jgi:hypothetical protein
MRDAMLTASPQVIYAYPPRRLQAGWSHSRGTFVSQVRSVADIHQRQLSGVVRKLTLEPE